METAYGESRAQQPHRIPAAVPYTPIGWRQECISPVTGKVPPLTLLLASNEAKSTQTTIIHHGAKWRISKHHMTPQDLPTVPKDYKQMLRTCWACDPNPAITLWPVLHLIARRHTRPTTHLPARAYARVAPWFRPTDTKSTVAVDLEHKPQGLFTTTPTWTCPNPTGIAFRYKMYKPGRMGKHKHPYYAIHHLCNTPKHLTQTLMFGNLNPDTAYIL